MAVSIAVICGCTGDNFDASERQEVKSFKKASDLFVNAAEYRREIFQEDQTERVQVGSVTQKQMNKYIRKLEAARNEAAKVSDPVLAKIHPDLPAAFHNLMVRSLDHEIASMKQRELSQIAEHQVKAVTLHNRWIDWWNANNHQFVTE